MAIRVPARTRSSTQSTGLGTYTLEEPTSVGWRNFTRAVIENDLANGDQVLYCVADLTTNPIVQEVGLGTYNNTTKTLTRDTVYQPNGSAVSWGAGVRDVFVIDPVQLAVLTLGNQTITGAKTFNGSLLTAILSGAALSVDGTTALLVQRSGTTSDACRLSIVGGNAGFSEVAFGDSDAQYRGRVVYDHTNERLDLYTAAVLRARLSSAGLVDASGNKYDAFPSGTRLILANNSVPSGWSIVASLADKVLLTTSTVSEIDDQAGSWTVSGVTIGATTLTVDQIPAHVHTSVNGGGFVTVGATGLADPGSGTTFNATNNQTASAGGGNSHTHTFSQNGSWRPSYYKTGVIQKT